MAMSDAKYLRFFFGKKLTAWQSKLLEKLKDNPISIKKDKKDND